MPGNISGLKLGQGWNKGLPNTWSKPPKVGFGKDNPFYGRKHSEETKKKMRLAKLGKPGNRKGKKASPETIEKLRLSHKGQVISEEARRKISAANSGMKSHLWKGGIYKNNSDERIKSMNLIEYKIWRKRVYDRDEYTCQLCGDDKGRNLQANHIKRYIDYPSLRYELSNGITLCKNCHMSIVTHHEKEWESYFNFILELNVLKGGYTYPFEK